MSRTQSQGLEYFPFAVDFFSDTKIRILKARYGTDGLCIYQFILCQIYREGYYTKADEDFIYVVSDELKVSSDKVEQVITFLLKRSMFDEQLFRSDAVLTCAGIQERWQEAVKTRAVKTPMEVSKYWLLKPEKTKPFIKYAHFNNSSEKKEDNSKKKGDNSWNYPQSKVKESKGKESKVDSVTHFRPPTLEEVEDYCSQRNNKVNPQRFIDHYTSNGWMVGKTKMKDWKAAVRTWENNGISNKQKAEEKGVSYDIDAYKRSLDKLPK